VFLKSWRSKKKKKKKNGRWKRKGKIRWVGGGRKAKFVKILSNEKQLNCKNKREVTNQKVRWQWGREEN